eukprot:TRINITY_DN5498_c0_g1_i1.p1 TRINITY_DN5498_c0_g1~~TRINITY_DN5498_c0_g1_i1.p1  ORF type:complete len:324 (-),score=99.05 TRINITY_DN5498_c0_g1_i1:600-1478(-)
MLTLRNKTVVITGASTGMGKQMALECAKVGAKLVISARREAMLQEVAQECLHLGATAVSVVVADMTRPEDCERVVESCSGGIDLLVLNAGVLANFTLEECQREVAERVMATDFFGQAWTAKAALPYLKMNKGMMLVMSSASALAPIGRMTFYAAAKSALRAFCDSLRHELYGTGVSITVAFPGFVLTDMTRGLNTLAGDGRSLYERSGGDTSKSLGLPLMAADVCARRVLEAAVCRERSITLPAWYRVFSVIATVAPSFFEWFVARKRDAAVRMRHNMEASTQQQNQLPQTN